MRKLVIALMLLGLSSACTTNGVYDNGKTWTLVGAVVVGGIVASQSGGNSNAEQDCFYHMNGDGSTSTVCR